MKYYLVGIKGTGMSALAKVLIDLGHEVTGSDVKESYYTDEELNKRNIKIRSFNKENIKENIIYIASSCYSEDNVEVKEIKRKGYRLFYYHEFLGTFFGGTKIGVSGTHGKTTTTHLINNFFDDEKKATIIGDGYGSANLDYKYFLFEACEYQNHFLSYDFDTLVINNIDLDHLDFFENIDDVFRSFQKAANNSKRVIINNDDEYCKKIKHDNIVTFGMNDGANIRGEIVDRYYNGYLLNVFIDKNKYQFILPIPGIYFIYDFLAAISVYYCYKKNLKEIQEKMYNFKNPKRRMQEYIYFNNVIIDDYAHHPSEIKCCLEAIKQKYVDKELVVVFQPHTYTRTIRLKDKFVGLFNSVNEFYLAKTFTSKREKKDKDLEEQVKEILGKPKSFDKKVLNKLKKKENSVILFLGAGNISECINTIIKKRKNKK